MKRPRRKPNPYAEERDRLLSVMETLTPHTDEYQKVLTRLDQLDKILNRTSELKKTVIPALGAVSGVVGIYGLQQFGGVIIPRALEALNARREERKTQKELED